MYWQRTEDNEDRMITALMIKNEFEESKHFLYLADNESLDKTDRFAKLDMFRPVLCGKQAVCGLL